ncbi:MAG: DUF445 domain-containing protein, partial [Elstera sp.]
MKAWANGLLLGSASLFIGLSLVPSPSLWVLAARAAAEAATIGALADWFAVTALFKRPLGLPIPHTALLPRNKARIGARLGQFVGEKFLDPDTLAHTLTEADLPGHLATWLDDPEVRSGISAAALSVLPGVLDALKNPPVRDPVQAKVAEWLGGLDLAGITQRGLVGLVEQGGHLPLLDKAADWALGQLTAEEPRIKAFLQERAVTYLAGQMDSGLTRLLRLDTKSLADGKIAKWLADELAEAILADAVTRLEELRTPGSPLRHQAHAYLLQHAHSLAESEAWAANLARLKDYLLAPERFGQRFAGLWDQVMDDVSAGLPAARPALENLLEGHIQSFTDRLRQDPVLRARVTAQAETLVRALITRYRPLAVGYIGETVARWDDRAVTEQFEGAVGRDLQFIRINGTCVGALAGLALFLVDHFILSAG